MHTNHSDTYASASDCPQLDTVQAPAMMQTSSVQANASLLVAKPLLCDQSTLLLPFTDLQQNILGASPSKKRSLR
jgi:hypothetical protein